MSSLLWRFSQFDSTKWLKKIDSPEIHLVVGGFPCQGFLVAGKRN